jgi:hypothetical protein
MLREAVQDGRLPPGPMGVTEPERR